MKILYLTSRLPWPLDKGDKLRAYHQIRQLSEHHEVYLFSLTDKNPSSEDLEELRAITKDVKVFKLKTRVRLIRLLFALVSRRPFQLHWFYQRSAQKMLSRWIQDIEPNGIFCQLSCATLRFKEWAFSGEGAVNVSSAFAWCAGAQKPVF